MTLSNKHHMSTGYYFSWEMKGNYGLNENSSVGQYAHKPTVKGALGSTFLVQSMNTELQATILNMKRILAGIPKMIAPVIQVAYDIQSTEGNIDIEKTSASHVGVWQSSLSVNAVTKGFHTEHDVTYTTINIPSQEKKSAERKYHFIFKIQNKLNISLPLIEGTTILFSGKLLTHRQTCNVFECTDDELFFNFASYGNKKLYSHIRQSFIRSGM